MTTAHKNKSVIVRVLGQCSVMHDKTAEQLPRQLPSAVLPKPFASYAAATAAGVCPHCGTQMPWNLLGVEKGSCTRATSVQLAASITSTNVPPAASTPGASTTPSSSDEDPGRATNTGSPAQAAAAGKAAGPGASTCRQCQLRGRSCMMLGCEGKSKHVHPGQCPDGM
jgi:hypothetical protein